MGAWMEGGRMGSEGEGAGENRTQACRGRVGRRHAARPRGRSPIGGRIALGWWLGLALVSASLGPLLGVSVAQAAEAQRIEVLGSHRIQDAQRGKQDPKDEAIRQALWEGVSRVALELLGEEGDATEADPSAGTPGTGAASQGAKPDVTARFRRIFGRDIRPYTQSYRIVEDRGERPVLFADEPGVRSEYLVVVEVLVDLDRVTSELARAGLIASAEPARGGESVEIELLGIEQYSAFRRVETVLRSALAASRIETLEYSPARQLLRVESPHGTEAIAARLSRHDSAELILEPVEIDREGRRIQVLGQVFEPAPDPLPSAVPAETGAAATNPR